MIDLTVLAASSLVIAFLVILVTKKGTVSINLNSAWINFSVKAQERARDIPANRIGRDPDHGQ